VYISRRKELNVTVPLQRRFEQKHWKGDHLTQKVTALSNDGFALRFRRIGSLAPWQRAACFQHEQMVGFRQAIGNSAHNTAEAIAAISMSSAIPAVRPTGTRKTRTLNSGSWHHRRGV
jgi:hypothetical protein